MKVSEFKMKLVHGINGFIDDYFGTNTTKDRLINTTLKIYVEQNQNALDDIINLFANSNNEINANEILTKYADIIGDKGIVFDIRDFIKSPFLKPILPDKVLLIKKEDILNILEN